MTIVGEIVVVMEPLAALKGTAIQTFIDMTGKTLATASPRWSMLQAMKKNLTVEGLTSGMMSKLAA